LITASLDERLQSHDRALCLLARKVDRLHQAAIEGERAKAARNIDLAAEQRRARRVRT
jgi:short-subunit dehydrogenase